jgi:type IV pilus assembly protein PilE
MKDYVKQTDRINLHQPRQLKGMTLIELMIVVAIVAILASIAYPSYTNYIAKSNRADGQGALMAFASAMERYAALNPNTGYADAVGTGGAPLAAIFPSEAPLSANDKTYGLTLTVTAAVDGFSNGYTLSATPKGKMDGDACGTFTLTNVGVRAVSTAKTDCWK